MHITFRKPILLVSFLIIIVMVSIALVVLWNKSVDQESRAQQPEHSNDPSKAVDTFLLALKDNNIKLAKELVFPTQQARIDKWENDSHPKANDCPYTLGWILSKSFQVHSGSETFSTEVDNNTVKVSGRYFCNNDGYSIRVQDAIVRSNGTRWIITDWLMICERSSSHDVEETCYR